MPDTRTTSYLLPIINAWQSGDARAGDRLFAYVRERLVVACNRLSLTNDRILRTHEVDDVVHDAVLRFIKAARAVEIEGARHFLNLANQHLFWAINSLGKKISRRSKSAPPEPQSGDRADDPINNAADEADTPASEVAWHELVARLPELPEGQAEVFHLRYFHELTFAEISELIGTSERTAKRRWQQARELLGSFFK